MSLSEADRVATFAVAPDHPAFAGHFPGHPIWPGVALLSEVMEALLVHQPAVRHGATWTIESVKFLAPVGPGAQLRIALQRRVVGHAFEVTQGAMVVARGQLTWTPVTG